MTATIASALRPLFSAVSGFNVLGTDQAYRNYRNFKNLDARAMRDMGITEADVDRARVSDFI